MSVLSSLPNQGYRRCHIKAIIIINTPSSFIIIVVISNLFKLLYSIQIHPNQKVWKSSRVKMTIFSSCRLLPLFANLTFLSLLTRSSHFRPICSLLCISFPARDGKRRENILLLFPSCIQRRKVTQIIFVLILQLYYS